MLPTPKPVELKKSLDGKTVDVPLKYGNVPTVPPVVVTAVEVTAGATELFEGTLCAFADTQAVKTTKPVTTNLNLDMSSISLLDDLDQ
jgi:hypothetical protein